MHYVLCHNRGQELTNGIHQSNWTICLWNVIAGLPWLAKHHGVPFAPFAAVGVKRKDSLKDSQEVLSYELYQLLDDHIGNAILAWGFVQAEPRDAAPQLCHCGPKRVAYPIQIYGIGWQPRVGWLVGEEDTLEDNTLIFV